MFRLSSSGRRIVNRRLKATNVSKCKSLAGSGRLQGAFENISDDRGQWVESLRYCPVLSEFARKNDDFALRPFNNEGGLRSPGILEF